MRIAHARGALVIARRRYFRGNQRRYAASIIYDDASGLFITNAIYIRNNRMKIQIAARYLYYALGDIGMFIWNFKYSSRGANFATSVDSDNNIISNIHIELYMSLFIATTALMRCE